MALFEEEAGMPSESVAIVGAVAVRDVEFSLAWPLHAVPRQLPLFHALQLLS